MHIWEWWERSQKKLLWHCSCNCFHWQQTAVSSSHIGLHAFDISLTCCEKQSTPWDRMICNSATNRRWKKDLCCFTHWQSKNCLSLSSSSGFPHIHKILFPILCDERLFHCFQRCFNFTHMNCNLDLQDPQPDVHCEAAVAADEKHCHHGMLVRQMCISVHPSFVTLAFCFTVNIWSSCQRDFRNQGVHSMNQIKVSLKTQMFLRWKSLFCQNCLCHLNEKIDLWICLPDKRLWEIPIHWFNTSTPIWIQNCKNGMWIGGKMAWHKKWGFEHTQTQKLWIKCDWWCRSTQNVIFVNLWTNFTLIHFCIFVSALDSWESDCLVLVQVMSGNCAHNVFCWLVARKLLKTHTFQIFSWLFTCSCKSLQLQSLCCLQPWCCLLSLFENSFLKPCQSKASHWFDWSQWFEQGKVHCFDKHFAFHFLLICITRISSNLIALVLSFAVCTSITLMTMLAQQLSQMTLPVLLNQICKRFMPESQRFRLKETSSMVLCHCYETNLLILLVWDLEHVWCQQKFKDCFDKSFEDATVNMPIWHLQRKQPPALVACISQSKNFASFLSFLTIFLSGILMHWKSCVSAHKELNYGASFSVAFPIDVPLGCSIFISGFRE